MKNYYIALNYLTEENGFGDAMNKNEPRTEIDKTLKNKEQLDKIKNKQVTKQLDDRQKRQDAILKNRQQIERQRLNARQRQASLKLKQNQFRQKQALRDRLNKSNKNSTVQKTSQLQNKE